MDPSQIIRGVGLGLALIMYGREEGAETLIEQMTRNQDPILRCGLVRSFILLCSQFQKIKETSSR